MKHIWLAKKGDRFVVTYHPNPTEEHNRSFVSYRDALLFADRVRKGGPIWNDVPKEDRKL